MNIGVLINHSISFVTSPLAVSLALIAAGIALAAGEKRKGKMQPSRFPFLTSHFSLLSLVGLLYLWFMSTGLASRWLGLGLERAFPPERVEALPQADAVVILGGGMGGNTNTVFYPELYPAADRVVHAARIWKAGKAPVIMASGTNELVATVPFLLELGVPRQAIRVENKSGNTEENARFVAATLKQKEQSSAISHLSFSTSHSQTKPRVLLVTSAWHMRRALLMFRKYAPEIEVVPAACDYEATIGSDEFNFFGSLLPSADALYHNSVMLKEIIGYWGYRLLRR